MPNPYDPEELKRQAQIRSLTSDEYYALNQANAQKSPTTQVKQSVWTPDYTDEYRRQYGRDYAQDMNSMVTDPKSGNRMVKTGAIIAALGAGGVFGAGLAAGGAGAAAAGGGAATAGAGGAGAGTGLTSTGLLASSVPAASMSTFAAPVAASGTGAATGVGTAAAAGGAKIPWGKLLSSGATVADALTSKPDQPVSTSPSGTPLNTTMPVTEKPKTTTPAPTATQAPAPVPVVNAPPPPGWDAKNWADPNMHTVKYDAGRLLYGASKPSEIAKIVASPAFQARFPGATFDGKDKIDFKGALSEGTTGSPVGIIDVLMAADQATDSSNGLWWGFEPESGGNDAPAPMFGMGPRVNQAPLIADDNSTIARIMAELTAASQGTPSPTEREAILQMLTNDR